MTAAEALDSSAVRAVPLWQDAILVVRPRVVRRRRGRGDRIHDVGAPALDGRLDGDDVRGADSRNDPAAARVHWEFQKYLFVTNLPLPDYATGSPPPIPGMTVPFSVVVLAVWAAAALAVSFEVFARRDVLA